MPAANTDWITHPTLLVFPPCTDMKLFSSVSSSSHFEILIFIIISLITASKEKGCLFPFYVQCCIWNVCNSREINSAVDNFKEDSGQNRCVIAYRCWSSTL